MVPEEPCYDVNGSGFVDTGDIAEMNSHFGGTDAFYDFNGSGFVDTGDMAFVTSQFGQACVSRFTYNGDGLRVARAGSYLNWKYAWDVGSGLPVILKETDSHQEVSGQGTDNTYVYGLDLISVTGRTGSQTYFLSDGLGSTANLTDASGNTTASYSYDVFGAIRSENGTGAGANEWRFTGEQRDRQGNRNFYYLRARYYDPATGRFLSQDPLGAGNPYVYADNNPVRFTDPSGLCIPDINCPRGFTEARDKEGRGMRTSRQLCAGCSSYELQKLIGELLRPIFFSEEEAEDFGQIVGELEYKRSGRAVSVETDEPEKEAEEIFERLKEGAEEVDVPGYPGGKMYDRPDGTRVGLRIDRDGNPTIDVNNNPVGSWREIKFVK